MGGHDLRLPDVFPGRPVAEKFRVPLLGRKVFQKAFHGMSLSTELMVQRPFPQMVPHCCNSRGRSLEPKASLHVWLAKECSEMRKQLPARDVSAHDPPVTGADSDGWLAGSFGSARVSGARSTASPWKRIRSACDRKTEEVIYDVI